MGSSFPLTNSYFSRWLLHHQADYHPMIFLSQPWKRPWQMTDSTNPKRLPGASEVRIALVAINIYIYIYIGNMISYGNVWLLNIIINNWIWYWIVSFFRNSQGLSSTMQQVYPHAQANLCYVLIPVHLLYNRSTCLFAKHWYIHIMFHLIAHHIS